MHAEAIAILEAIEADCDTAALTYHDVNYWPLVRLRLWSALMQRFVLAKKSADGESVANTGPTWPAVESVDAEIASPLGLLRVAGSGAKLEPKPDAIFFARPEEHGEKTEAGAYAKIVDSVLEQARTRFSCSKWELAEARTLGFKRRYPSLFVDLPRAGEGLRFDPPGALNAFAAVKQSTQRIAAIDLDEAALTADMGRICYFARVFQKLLRASCPRALFLSVYYHPIGMAWMLACRRAGVISVDLQHGRLGPHHGLYTSLTAAPADGYALLPDHIWCWGERTRADIALKKNPVCARHNGFVGGNPWLYKWRYGDTAAFAPPGLEAFRKQVQDKRKILVSLQPLDAPISPELLQAMRLAPQSRLWLLRLHPLRRHTAPEIASLLARQDITNIEIENASAFPLFALLALIDHHVTAFSSVTIEAAAFDLHTSLTAAEGLAAFAPELANGTCRYTPTAEALVAHIHEVLAASREPLAHDFIDMSEGIVDRALDRILLRARDQ